MSFCPLQVRRNNGTIEFNPAPPFAYEPLEPQSLHPLYRFVWSFWASNHSLRWLAFRREEGIRNVLPVISSILLQQRLL